jgi:hypothetical protein
MSDAYILTHLIEHCRVVLLLDSSERYCDYHTLLGWKLKVLANLRLCMSKRDLTEELAEKMSVVGNKMAPKSAILVERPITKKY